MSDDAQDQANDNRTRRLRDRIGAGGSGSSGGAAAGTDDGQRPRAVYVVLAIGVVSLLILLLVIYFSSDRDLPEQPICTAVSVEDAQDAVLQGRISRITLAYDDAAAPPSADNWGPVLARLDYTDGQCANLPQGIMRQDDIYLLLGTITVFNDITESAQVEITYDRTTALDGSLYATPTPPPTPTPEPTATPEPTREPSPTPGPTPSGPILGPVFVVEGTPGATPED
jgi:hypothetical protein